MHHASDTKDERENRRRQECGGEARSTDQNATALSRCEEFLGSAAKIVTPMRSMATDRGDRAFIVAAPDDRRGQTTITS